MPREWLYSEPYGHILPVPVPYRTRASMYTAQGMVQEGVPRGGRVGPIYGYIQGQYIGPGPVYLRPRASQGQSNGARISIIKAGGSLGTFRPKG